MITYFAGMESSMEQLPLVRDGYIENTFCSYYYMNNNARTTAFMHKIKSVQSKLSRPGLMVIDSGAHSFFAENTGSFFSASSHKKETKTRQTPQEFFDGYVSWLKANWTGFDYFVELDIGELVGQERVLRWRDVLKLEGLYSKCITVYHPGCMTWEDFLDSIADSQSGYMALEGMRNGNLACDYTKCIDVALRSKIKLHGFAMTKRSLLYKYPLFSVDSSSWKAGVQYGASLAVGSLGDIVNARFMTNGMEKLPMSPNLDKLVKGTPREQRLKRCEVSARAYQQIAEDVTEFWKDKGIVYNW